MELCRHGPKSLGARENRVKQTKNKINFVCVVFVKKNLFRIGKTYLRCCALKMSKVSSSLEQSFGHDMRRVSKQPACTRLTIFCVIICMLWSPSPPPAVRLVAASLGIALTMVRTEAIKPDAGGCPRHHWAATALLFP